MGLYLASTTLNQAALAQGQARARRRRCWIACAIGFLVWSLIDVARAGAPDRGRLPRRRGGRSSRLLGVLYRRADERGAAAGSSPAEELEARLALADEAS